MYTHAISFSLFMQNSGLEKDKIAPVTYTVTLFIYRSGRNLIA